MFLEYRFVMVNYINHIANSQLEIGDDLTGNI